MVFLEFLKKKIKGMFKEITLFFGRSCIVGDDVK